MTATFSRREKRPQMTSRPKNGGRISDPNERGKTDRYLSCWLIQQQQERAAAASVAVVHSR